MQSDSLSDFDSESTGTYRDLYAQIFLWHSSEEPLLHTDVPGEHQIPLTPGDHWIRDVKNSLETGRQCEARHNIELRSHVLCP